MHEFMKQRKKYLLYLLICPLSSIFLSFIAQICLYSMIAAVVISWRIPAGVVEYKYKIDHQKKNKIK